MHPVKDMSSHHGRYESRGGSKIASNVCSTFASLILLMNKANVGESDTMEGDNNLFSEGASFSCCTSFEFVLLLSTTISSSPSSLLKSNLSVESVDPGKKDNDDINELSLLFSTVLHILPANVVPSFSHTTISMSFDNTFLCLQMVFYPLSLGAQMQHCHQGHQIVAISAKHDLCPRGIAVKKSFETV